MLLEIRLKAARCGEVSLTVCTCSATVLRTFAGGGTSSLQSDECLECAVGGGG